MCSFRVALERHLKSRSRLPVRLVFSGMFFVSCLLVSECRGRDEHFLKKIVSMLFIFLRFLGGFSWLRNEGFYPMTVKTYISWSPKKYEMGMGGISTLLPRAYQEKISFNLTKVALNDWIMKSHFIKINCGNWTTCNLSMYLLSCWFSSFSFLVLSFSLA